jgi:hypothetical protein
MVICAADALIRKSFAMSPSEGAIILADMIGMSWPKEKIVPISILRRLDQLYGSEGSLGEIHVLWCCQ